MNINEKIIKIIREAGYFFYATTEKGKPRVRPLGYIEEIEGRLVIALSTTKAIDRKSVV